jgi:protein-S-isoprenylcysteine O-methyltransferase Ste14
MGASMGRRGEGWVVLQAAVLVAAAVLGWLAPPWPEAWATPLRAAGVVVALAGLPLILGGSVRLGSALTPFPEPVEGASLREDGVYALVRHPIYGGVVLLSLGWALATSPAALPATAALVAVFEGKRRREEAWLLDTHPGYAEYRRRVRRRFIPWVW